MALGEQKSNQDSLLLMFNFMLQSYFFYSNVSDAPDIFIHHLLQLTGFE